MPTLVENCRFNISQRQISTVIFFCKRTPLNSMARFKQLTDNNIEGIWSLTLNSTLSSQSEFSVTRATQIWRSKFTVSVPPIAESFKTLKNKGENYLTVRPTYTKATNICANEVFQEKLPVWFRCAFPPGSSNNSQLSRSSKSNFIILSNRSSMCWLCWTASDRSSFCSNSFENLEWLFQHQPINILVDQW